MAIRVVALLLLLSFFTFGQHQQRIRDVCQFCLCSSTSIACNDFDKFPIETILNNIPPKYKKLVINGASLPRLEPSHLQSVAQLVHLKIVHSEIESLDPRTFAHMSQLKELDLSFNKINYLSPSTFSGLDLDIFELTNQYSLRLDADTFSNLRAETLNLRSNGIRELDMRTFKQIQGLKKLHLFNNSIERLSTEVKAFFDDESRFLDLTENPLICNCDLNWLAKKVVPWSKDSIRSDINITCKYLEKNKYGALTGRSLTVELVKMVPDKLCAKANIEGLDINLQDDGKNPVLSCRASSIANLDVFDTPYGRNFNPSEMMTVKPPHVVLKYLADGETISKYIPEKDLSSSFVKTSKVDIELEMTKEPRNYSCEARGENESVQTVLLNIRGLAPQKRLVPTTTVNAAEGIRVAPSDKDEHYLFRKQFTLFEMIGAIMGTFILTMVLLVICSRCYYVLCGGKSRLCFGRSSCAEGKEASAKEMVTTSTKVNGTSSTNSSGATISVNPQMLGLNYPLSPSTPGPQYASQYSAHPNSVAPSSFFQTLSPQQKHCLMSQQTPLLQNSLSHAALLAGYWPTGVPPPPGSPFSMHSHEYDVPRNHDFTPFDQGPVK
ncbi:hypothetical protein Ciccas_006354 [Cichlidogyrus casuarinus]|uniref:Ig-like domain-containing protein n=1 Tax=Cichlidogyrus casuarinus TaxID=1844966 RepID=A0ABD2Q5Z8_9PLAT